MNKKEERAAERKTKMTKKAKCFTEDVGANEMKKRRVHVGEIYEDCSYHPVLCTESSADDVSGISLIDGTYPRSCSPMHCGIRRLTLK